ncbi:NAD(P)H-dependent flavin oxidoreductase [Chachezhania sediminis]|uniref:NAD(P)H-dependent flavin oxidoreductase n=1 Tax=Chachezhania sediminis TaxID=2599291 RepID=UPI00131C69F1|nr:nitronate monooxygenase [Chachezhania sediminis]
MPTCLTTRFTERFGLDHPIALAPMDKISGGALAAAVSEAGGLGLIGGGYADGPWLAQALAQAGNRPVGVGFITWSALEHPETVEIALNANPKALMVSFGDAEPLVEAAQAKGIPVIWQVQTLAQAKQALAAHADVIVAQGQEAGGHGMSRGLMSLLPTIRDLAGKEQIILGAGGIADGRGLAAVMMLGGDGVLMGTRFWACQEASGPQSAKDRMLGLGGDDTIRSKVFDVARDAGWPWHFTGRVVRNRFLNQWHDDPDLQARAPEAQAAYDASDEEDYGTRVLIAGEALDLIRDLPTAAEIVERTSAEAASLLRGAASTL